MAEYVLSIAQFPTLPSWYGGEDDGEAWDCGDYICLLLKHPPFLSDAMMAMTKKLPPSAIPSSDSKGFRYLYILSMFYKRGRNPSGKDSSKPAEVMTIEQVNAGMLIGGPALWDEPVLCSFKPSGRWNSERKLTPPVTRDAARTAFFDELSRRGLPAPKKIGTERDGMAVITGSPAPSSSRGRSGCMVPIALMFGSLVAASIAIVLSVIN